MSGSLCCSSRIIVLHPGALNRGYLLDAPLGQTVGGLIRGNTLLARELEQLVQRIVDLACLPARAIGRPVVQLAIHVDETTRVDNVIGRVENFTPLQLIAVALLRQL